MASPRPSPLPPHQAGSAPQAGATPESVPAPTSAWPDTSIIAQIANAYFQAAPNSGDPGIPVAPPNPTFFPAPNGVTAAAPYFPANPGFGPPDLPPSTIPAAVPTPNLTAPQTPALSALHPGVGDPPMPGASAGSVGPTVTPFEEDAAALLIPSAHVVNPYEGSPAAPLPAPGASYFLGEAPLAGEKLDPFAAPATPSVATAPGMNAPDLRSSDAAWPADAAFDLGNSTQLVPSAHFANPYDGKSHEAQSFEGKPHEGLPPVAAPAPGDAYFLNETPMAASARPDAFAAAAKAPQTPAPTPAREAVAPAAPPKAAPAVSPAPTGHYNFLELDLRPLAAPARGAVGFPLDPHVIRKDFPILQERVNGGKPLVWLDNAATTQKPQAVIDRLSYFYEHENSNIHRAAHALAARATDAYEAAREKVRALPRARSSAQRDRLRARRHRGHQPRRQELGPAQHRAKATKSSSAGWNTTPISCPGSSCAPKKARKLRVAPGRRHGPDPARRIREAARARAPSWSRSPRFRTRWAPSRPVNDMIEMAHRHGARVLVDGAQAVSHMPSTCRRWTATSSSSPATRFSRPPASAWSTASADVLDDMPPWQGGGNMIADVTFEKTIYQPPPARFEAGTGNIADAVGLGAALDYVEHDRHGEHRALTSTTARLRDGGCSRSAACASSARRRRRPACSPSSSTASAPKMSARRSTQEGIAVRAGHHCAQPILRRFGLEATVRPSLAFYNTCEDVDALVAVLMKLQGRN